jgi:RNA polymerase sigma factor (sigma-70 family)
MDDARRMRGGRCSLEGGGATTATSSVVAVGSEAKSSVTLQDPERIQETALQSLSPDQAVLVELLRRAVCGDQSAWNALVDRFAGMVWAIARAHRLDEATAADVSQTTWLKLVEHLDRIEQPERIGAWLGTTARRESLRVIRMAGRQVPTGEDFDLRQAGVADAPVEGHMLVEERNQTLSALVDQLPCRCQLILRLLGADPPLSYKDLSEALGMPIGSIGPTRARCLEHLRRLGVQPGLVLADNSA